MNTGDAMEPESTDLAETDRQAGCTLPPVPDGFVVTPCTNPKADPHLPAKPPRGAHHVATVEWSWSPGSSLILSVLLSLDSAQRRWVLWHQTYDDETWTWDPPRPVATAPRCALEPRTAALLMLAQAWTDPDMRPSSDVFQMVSDPGLLDENELEDIEKVVWPK